MIKLWKQKENSKFSSLHWKEISWHNKSNWNNWEKITKIWGLMWSTYPKTTRGWRRNCLAGVKLMEERVLSSISKNRKWMSWKGQTKTMKTLSPILKAKYRDIRKRWLNYSWQQMGCRQEVETSSAKIIEELNSKTKIWNSWISSDWI